MRLPHKLSVVLFLISAMLLLGGWYTVQPAAPLDTVAAKPFVQPPPPFPLPPFPPLLPPYHQPYYRPSRAYFVPPTGQVAQPGPALDAQLRAALAQAGVTPLDPGPQPDPALVELGRALFFDKELSGNRDISCATCHHPLLKGADGLAVSIGTGAHGLGPTRQLGQNRTFIPRNAPELFNRGAPNWETMFWDGRVTGKSDTGFISPAGNMLPDGLDSVLAVQAMFPVTSRDEMRGLAGDVDVFGQPNELATFSDDNFPAMWAGLMQRLLSIPEYITLFHQAFPATPPGQLGFEHAANAMAAFEIDAFTFMDSPWDRYVAGNNATLSEEAKRGALLFYGEAGCSRCHSGPLLTDQKFYNIGVPQVGPGKGAESPLDFGRGRETGDLADRFKFRTPPLRNVGLTGPWMHNGAYNTLHATVQHHYTYADEALRNYNADQLHPTLRGMVQTDEPTVMAIMDTVDDSMRHPPMLTEPQLEQILAFLESLTSPSVNYLPDQIPLTVPSGLPVAD